VLQATRVAQLRGRLPVVAVGETEADVVESNAVAVETVTDRRDSSQTRFL
jgi:hypothetical protein